MTTVMASSLALGAISASVANRVGSLSTTLMIAFVKRSEVFAGVGVEKSDASLGLLKDME